jgi:cephalosporin hydroxylase
MPHSELPPRVVFDVEGSVRAYWTERVSQHTQDRYAGVGISKFPEDLRTYEHLLWSARANVVIELGTQYGGSALWFRDRLCTLARYGRVGEPRVVSVDLDVEPARAAIGSVDPSFEAIELVAGDVRDPSLPDLVARAVPHGSVCMVVEDTAHVYDTTMAALRGFSGFVAPGGFFVVEDGCLDLPALRVADEWPRGVLHALADWFASDASEGFAIRRDLELYGMTSHPYGFIQRVV